MEEIIDYLKNFIDEDAVVESWDAKKYLNLQLAGSYDYYLVSVLNDIFMLIKPVEEYTIQKIKMHIDRIREKVNYEVAILLESPTPYRVKKMLKERVAFITVDRQMYLPFLALHIKQGKNRKIEDTVRDRFTASTQLVFLFILYSNKSEYEVEELVRKLGLSSMTIHRAMEELKGIGVITQRITGRNGRKKVFSPIEQKKYYHIGKKYLINPVKKSFYVRDIPKDITVYKSGEMALAERTMLGEPKSKTYATYSTQSELMEYQVEKEQALEEYIPELQFMWYDIGKLTDNQYVDPVSLISSLDVKDDRTEIAIEELMEDEKWYEV